jgi:general stress protein 26
MEWVKTNNEAVEQLKRMVQGLDICMLITTDANGQRHNRPMAAINIDNDGNCWFFVSRSSGKLKDISVNNKLQLVFADPASDDYVEIHGVANAVCDENEIRNNWSPLVSKWFPGGITDPEICIVKLDVTNVFYWDEKAEGIQRLLIKTTTVVDDHRLAA